MNSEVQPSLLMMTATINPQPGAVGLDRTDPALRMKDYCEALDFYLSKKSPLDRRIVFVENSTRICPDFSDWPKTTGAASRSNSFRSMDWIILRSTSEGR